MADYSDFKNEFKIEGSLRDIYIFDASIELWEKFIDLVLKSGLSYYFWHGENNLSLPRKFKEIRLLQKSEPTTLKIYLVGSIQINCHFFCDDEIELDIDPREINGQPTFDVLLGFMKLVSIKLKRDVLLSHENSTERKILTVSFNQQDWA